MIPLPVPTQDQDIRSLARFEFESFTGIAAATLTLSQKPVESYLWIFKNGALLHNLAGADWTVSGLVVTFAAALVGGDKVTCFYYARPN